MMLWIVTLIRLLLPYLIFKWQITGIVLVIISDSLDWELLTNAHSLSFSQYQSWDKVLDIFFSAIAFIYIKLKWKNRFMKNVAAGLFCWRLIGVLLFEMTNIRLLLFIFPNVFDNFFIFYEFYRFFSKQLILINNWFITKTLYVIAFFKFIQEYLIHIAQIYPWQLEYGKFLKSSEGFSLYFNIFVWIILFIAAHAVLLIYTLHKHNLLKNINFRPEAAVNSYH